MEKKKKIAFFQKLDEIYFEVCIVEDRLGFEFFIYRDNVELISVIQSSISPSSIYRISLQTFMIISFHDSSVWMCDLKLSTLIQDKRFDGKSRCLIDNLIDDVQLLVSNLKLGKIRKELINIFSGTTNWSVDIPGIQVKFNNIVRNNTNDKILTLINKADGSIKWQFDFAKYIVFDLTKNPFNESTRFDLIALIKNELICIANSDRFLSIDINTGELLWELTECVYEDGYEKLEVFPLYFYGVTENRIHVLQGSIYMVLDIMLRQCIVKKDFRKNKEDENYRIHTSELYKNKFYFTADIGFSNHKWNRLGIFDITTREVIWQTTLKLPPGVILNQKPVVDDNHLYIKDSGNTLYIFEKNEDGSIKPTEFQVAEPTLVKQQPESATINIKKTVNPIEISKLSKTIQLMQKDGMDTAAITDFCKLAGTDDCINDDTENYWGIEHYESLLKGMAILAAPQINITVTDVLENKRKWIFNFTINNHPKSITMNNPNTDNLEDQFIEDMNQLTNEFCNTHTFIFAYPESIDEADQWFHLFYLSNEAIGKLQQSSYSYFD